MSKNENTKSNMNDNANLQNLLEIIISLQAKQVFSNEQLCNIVMKNKHEPAEGYVLAYNLCDGEHTLSQIASEINVSKGTLSPILAEWKNIGIIYEVVQKSGKFYKRLYKLELPKNRQRKEKKTETNSQTTSENQSSVTMQSNGETQNV